MDRPAIRLLNALIRRGIDDQDLYRQTATQVAEPGLRVVLGEMADTVRDIVIGLQAEVLTLGGKPATAGTTGGSLRRSLAGVQIGMANDGDVTGIRWLEQRESRLLVAFEQVAERPGCVQAIALRFLPRLRNVHIDMCSLAQAARS
jgi:uncharacterized protein (TIGR02284 family)